MSLGEVPGRRAAWRCDKCGTMHGAHPDGSPLGVPADRRTNHARRLAHEAFDRLWLEAFLPSRSAAYAWLRGVLRMNEEEAHIARFDVVTCELVADLAQDFVAGWSPEACPIVLADPAGLTSDGSNPDDFSSIDWFAELRPAPPATPYQDAPFVAAPEDGSGDGPAPVHSSPAAPEGTPAAAELEAFVVPPESF